jgi:HK97 gp10 family phage protein
MSKKIGNVTVDTSKLDAMGKEAKPKARKIVATYGSLITTDAIVRAPVDTGNLINTISANSKMIADMLFRVQDGTEYGIFQELGTSRMSARPFMFPALEAYRQKFINAFAELFK